MCFVFNVDLLNAGLYCDILNLVMHVFNNSKFFHFQVFRNVSNLSKISNLNTAKKFVLITCNKLQMPGCILIALLIYTKPFIMQPQPCIFIWCFPWRENPLLYWSDSSFGNGILVLLRQYGNISSSSRASTHFSLPNGFDFLGSLGKISAWARKATGRMETSPERSWTGRFQVLWRGNEGCGVALTKLLTCVTIQRAMH